MIEALGGPQIWVLLYYRDDYRQCGGYFVGLWTEKPTLVSFDGADMDLTPAGAQALIDTGAWTEPVYGHTFRLVQVLADDFSIWNGKQYQMAETP
jgi:hypothetical protein